MAGVTPLMEGSPDGFPPPATHDRFAGAADSGICSTGSTTLSSMAGRDCTSTMVTARAPPRNRAAASAGRTVGLTVRCAVRVRRSAYPAVPGSTPDAPPRLVPAMAWISSTMTVRTVDRMRRALEVRIRYSDSGVVTRMSGGCEAMARRSCAVVSPLRVATRDRRRVETHGLALGGDARQRRFQIARHIHAQRLQRRDIQHLDALGRVCGSGSRPPPPPPAHGSSTGRWRTGTRRASCRNRSAR